MDQDSSWLLINSTVGIIMKCSNCLEQRSFLTESNGKILNCRSCGYSEPFHYPRYDQYHSKFYSYARVRTPKNDPLLQKIVASMNIKKQHHVLDYGCGAGDYTAEFSKLSKHVIGVDINVDRASARFQTNTFKKQVGQKLEFRTHSIDRIICVNTIEHVKNFDRLVKEFYRVLKPGGKLFITTYDTRFFLHKILFDETHVYEWDRPGFSKFIATYFTINQEFKTGIFFNYYPFNWMITKFLKPELCIVATKKPLQ